MQRPNKPAGQTLLPGGTNGIANVTNAPSSSELRERAEQAARRKPPLSAMDLDNLSPELIRQTLHELQVHQIELQMQNEELQTAQIRLDKSRARYFDLYDLAPVGYCTVSEQGLITEANLAIASLLGLSRIHIVNQPISRFIQRAHQDRYYAYRTQVIPTGTARTCELQLLKSDGSIVWVTMATTTVFEDDGASVFRVVLSDITARKKMDQLLQDNNTALDEARRVADKSNHAKSDFLSSMSHELRTPLNAILGFAQLINAGSPTPTPTQKKSLDQILLAGWYLLDLINEILDLALVESGKLSLELEPVALAGVLHDCRTMIELQADQRGISLRYDPLEANFLVLADGMRLKQVLINLLSNAIKYNRPGGAVVVTCTEVADAHVRIGVKDTGEGLSPEQIAQLFQPFNRLGQESRTDQGTGIGLVMTKRLVGLMGGTIHVESAVGSGSTFWIEMRLTRAQTPSLVVASAPDRAAGSAPVNLAASLKSDTPVHTLLYIEDDPANLLLIESLMGCRPDIHMLSAQNGAQGLALAKAHLPDVILTDIHLPGISGIELLKILQDNPATRHIPVVALSANAIPSDIDKGLAAGFYRYLTKPIKIDVFMATLDAALLLATASSASTASSMGNAP